MLALFKERKDLQAGYVCSLCAQFAQISRCSIYCSETTRHEEPTLTGEYLGQPNRATFHSVHSTPHVDKPHPTCRRQRYQLQRRTRSCGTALTPSQLPNPQSPCLAHSPTAPPDSSIPQARDGKKLVIASFSLATALTLYWVSVICGFTHRNGQILELEDRIS